MSSSGSDMDSDASSAQSENDDPAKDTEELDNAAGGAENDVDELNNVAEENENEPMEQNDEDENDENDNSKEEVRFPVLNPISIIKNKERRNALFKKLMKEKMRKQRAARKQRRKEGAPKNPGHTIESLREPDQTAITQINNEDNEELRKELELDEFSSYFEKSYVPKVLITFADNPVTKTRRFGLELSRIFPNALVKLRNRSSVKKICKSAIREGFTDVVIVNENRRKPNGLLVIHLPGGPTAHFKVTNVKLTSDIKRNHREITRHRPEVVLTNFTTRLGLTVGRMLGALFHHDPEFKGRRVVTFHNQRDFIFFRHHRYEFTKDGRKAKLRELGPRFTLKLRSLQEGTFDSKCGDYTWIITNKRHAMEGRRRFFL